MLPGRPHSKSWKRQGDSRKRWSGIWQDEEKQRKSRDQSAGGGVQRRIGTLASRKGKGGPRRAWKENRNEEDKGINEKDGKRS